MRFNCVLAPKTSNNSIIPTRFFKLHVRVVPNSDIFEVGMITSVDKNFCFVRLKGKRIISERSGSKRKASSIDAGAYKANKTDPFSSPDVLIEHPNGPIRQYYHSRTMEPLCPCCRNTSSYFLCFTCKVDRGI
mmetsp:Transcript_14136/g.20904  ORF Transcript_14136/g.20904 Transcript_14136/m.20904 type:complete len:133 (-) Transcript_14136:845-1243(-)